MSLDKMRRDMIDLGNQRAKALEDASKAYDEGRGEDCTTMTNKAKSLGDQMMDLKSKIAEQERIIMDKIPDPKEHLDMAEEQGHLLMSGKEIKISASEVRRSLTNQVTVATGTLIKPTGAGTMIHDTVGGRISSIIDQVRVVDMSGMGSYLEPYVISADAEANTGKPEELAGTARPTITDPTFGVAEIKPYEINTTSFVDRNISKLTAANYYEKVFGMAMRSMRRTACKLILNGDGSISPTFFGFKTAKNKDGAAIYSDMDLSEIDVNILDELYFAYGSSDEMGPVARLMLTKRDLKAIGALRGTNEKRRLFEITPDVNNPNTGTIKDGGLVIPYTICSDLTSLSTAKAGDAPIPTMVYGDPLNFEMGLFGDFTVRTDESVKAVERMVAILGDAMVGGNLIVHHGMVVASLPAAAEG